MVRIKKNIRIVIGALFVAVIFSSCCCPFGESKKNAITNSSDVSQLQKGNWDASVYNALNNLIVEDGVKSANYNPEKKPYAVFDWDNTSIINDIGEGVMLYQAEHLKYKMTPEKMNTVIRENIPSDNFSKEFNNKEGKPVNIDLIAPDIVSDYSYLYNNYKGLNGTQTLSEIKKSLQYQDFVVKLRYLYEAIGGTFSPDISYPWVIYLFTGMNDKDVHNITEESIDYWLKQPMGKETYQSPEKLPGKAGIVSVTCYNGVRTVKEMQNLYNALMNNGFDVYVCSASFVDIIRTFATTPKYNYNVPKDHIIAMELERDKNGVIINKFREGYDQTQNKGKTKNINRFLVSEYGYGPVLVAGDSDGDYPMMIDFEETKVGLIINRCKDGGIGDLSLKAIHSKAQKLPNAKYVLQGRDENKGVFIPSSKTVLVGTEKAKLNK